MQRWVSKSMTFFSNVSVKHDFLFSITFIVSIEIPFAEETACKYLAPFSRIPGNNDNTSVVFERQATRRVKKTLSSAIMQTEGALPWNYRDFKDDNNNEVLQIPEYKERYVKILHELTCYVHKR